MSDQDPIERIKQALSIESIIRSQASDWDGNQGGDRVGRCTHPEHGHTSTDGNGTPNMIVTEDGGWYCYSHETGGGVFEWVAVEEGICGCRNLPLTDEQFKETLRVAADRAGVDLSGGDADYEDLSAEQRARHALESAIDILHDNLDTVVDGVTVRHKIKEERGFDDETIDKARIGYIDDQTHAELLEELTKEQLRATGFHDEDDNLRVRNRIVYPYLSAGRARYWIARATDNSPHPAKYNKPPTSSDLTQPIYKYNPSDPRQSQDVWVVEGIQDAISTAEAGKVRAISAVATNPSAKQISQLIEEASGADRVIVCFDSDESGEDKACDLAVRLMRAGVETYIAFVPDGEDPNDYLKGDGKFADLTPQLAAREIVNQQGETESVLKDICSTVEPNTPRADMLIDALSDETACRKKTLRKLVREQYRHEDQQGWVEPERIEKTVGVDTEWTLIYPDGTEIVMEDLMGNRAPKKFCNKYAANFNFLPDIDRDEWIDTVNDWLQEVAVTEVSPLSPEALARENVAEELNQSDVSVTWKDALKTPHIPAGYDGDDTILVESDAVDNWTDDDLHLRKVSEYIDPIMDGGTVQKYVDEIHKRMWPLDVEAMKDEGLPVPEASETPDDIEPDEDAADPVEVDDDV